jgi:TM2 domain-containing membrane protein YozV
MTAEQPGPRIGNQDREQAVAALADHYSSGRLDGDEYSRRVARAWEARTAPELSALFSDLPDPRAQAAPPPAPYPPPQPWPGPMAPGMMDPSAPWGREPYTGRPYSDKSKVVAGVLQLFLPFGVGRFYTGHTGIAVAQLLVTFLTFGIGGIWGFIDGIVILAGQPDDPYGRPLRN